jgi:uncharacterized protein YcbK (DUF882 family)
VVGMTSMENQIVSVIKLSRNFRLNELTKSSTALRLGIDNTASDEVIDQLEWLCLKVLQPVRDHFGKSVNISSGFRCLELNRKLGSGDNSQHTTGNAADLEIFGIDNYVVACWIRDNLDFDQLILEFYDGTPNSGWVHVSWKERHNRMECLTIGKGTTSRGLKK